MKKGKQMTELPEVLQGGQRSNVQSVSHSVNQSNSAIKCPNLKISTSESEDHNRL